MTSSHSLVVVVRLVWWDRSSHVELLGIGQSANQWKKGAEGVQPHFLLINYGIVCHNLKLPCLLEVLTITSGL